MTTYLSCNKCGYKFAANTMEYLSGELECPRCGIHKIKIQSESYHYTDSSQQS